MSHLLGLLFEDLSVCLLQLLQIFASLITSEHVLNRSLVEMVGLGLRDLLNDLLEITTISASLSAEL